MTSHSMITPPSALPRYPKARVVWIGLTAGATCFALIVGVSLGLRSLGVGAQSRQRTVGMAIDINAISRNLDTTRRIVDSIKTDVRELRSSLRLPIPREP